MQRAAIGQEFPHPLECWLVIQQSAVQAVAAAAAVANKQENRPTGTHRPTTPTSEGRRRQRPDNQTLVGRTRALGCLDTLLVLLLLRRRPPRQKQHKQSDKISLSFVRRLCPLN